MHIIDFREGIVIFFPFAIFKGIVHRLVHYPRFTLSYEEELTFFLSCGIKHQSMADFCKMFTRLGYEFSFESFNTVNTVYYVSDVWWI